MSDDITTKNITRKTFSIDQQDHFVGDEDCDSCWHTPKKCKWCDDPENPGLVHTQFGDENYHGDYWLYYECDKCGCRGSQD